MASAIRALGGTLLTAIGQLHINDVTRIELSAISATDARRAGYSSREDCWRISTLDGRRSLRIELGPLSPDPRVSLVILGRQVMT